MDPSTFRKKILEEPVRIQEEIVEVKQPEVKEQKAQVKFIPSALRKAV